MPGSLGSEGLVQMHQPGLLSVGLCGERPVTLPPSCRDSLCHLWPACRFSPGGSNLPLAPGPCLCQESRAALRSCLSALCPLSGFFNPLQAAHPTRCTPMPSRKALTAASLWPDRVKVCRALPAETYDLGAAHGRQPCPGPLVPQGGRGVTLGANAAQCPGVRREKGHAWVSAWTWALSMKAV